MSTPLRVGIAGYGVVGSRRHQYIDQCSDLRTVCVCDRKMSVEGISDNGIRFHTTYQQLLEEDLDVLFVCLTNDVAAEATIAGLEKGLHVFCEKPPGKDLDDIARVIACERTHPGLKLKYGFNHRYHDSVREALRIVRSGELGRVINLRGVYGKSKIINFESDWRTRRAVAGGGILLDQGIHMVDLLRLFAGEFSEIHSFVSNGHWHHDVEDNAYALMRTADGVVAVLHSTATEWRHRFRLEVSLERGTIVLSGLLTGSKSYGAETITVARKTDHDEGDPNEETRHFDHDPSWADEIADFAAAVRNDTAIVDGSSDEALKTMHLVYRIYCADVDWGSRHGLSDVIPQIAL
jgi:predicted dehydrogenase